MLQVPSLTDSPEACMSKLCYHNFRSILCHCWVGSASSLCLQHFMILPLTPGYTLLPWRLKETSLKTFPGILRSNGSDVRSALICNVVLVTTRTTVPKQGWDQGLADHMLWFSGWESRMVSKTKPRVDIIKATNEKCWERLIFPILPTV